MIPEFKITSIPKEFKKEIKLEDLYKDGVPEIKNASELFTEEDMNEAEDIMKYCKGLKSKFGR